MMSYTPALTMGVWLGNPDTTILRNGTSSLGSPIVAKVMEYAHKEVYAPEGKWTSGDWFAQPQGIQRIGGEVYPSWWSKSQGQSNATLTFDRLSKKKATECTPEAAKINADVIKITDPVTKKDSYSNVPAGYDAKEDDNIHKCSDSPPSISDVKITGNSGNWTITITVSPGTFGSSGISVTASASGSALSLNKTGSSYKATYNGTSDPAGDIVVNVIDSGYYTDSGTY